MKKFQDSKFSVPAFQIKSLLRGHRLYKKCVNSPTSVCVCGKQRILINAVNRNTPVQNNVRQDWWGMHEGALVCGAADRQIDGAISPLGADE